MPCAASTASPKARVRRREALRAGTAGALALGLAACGAESDGPPAEPTEEALLLAELRELERSAGHTYEEGARFTAERTAANLRRLAEQSAEHTAAIQDLLDAEGAPPITVEQADPVFIRDSDTALRAARDAARRLPAAYVGAIPRVTAPQRRVTLMTILGNDAEQLVVLGGLAASSALPGERGA